jgi:hypothetical protein
MAAERSNKGKLYFRVFRRDGMLPVGGGVREVCGCAREVVGVAEVNCTYRVVEMHVCGARGAGLLARCSASRPIGTGDEVRRVIDDLL